MNTGWGLVVTLLATAMGSGGLVAIINGLFNRGRVKVEATETLTDSALELVKQARMDARDAWTQAAEARREAAEARREATEARREAMDAVRELRHLRLAIVNPLTTLEQLRAMVGEPPANGVMEGARL